MDDTSFFPSNTTERTRCFICSQIPFLCSSHSILANNNNYDLLVSFSSELNISVRHAARQRKWFFQFYYHLNGDCGKPHAKKYAIRFLTTIILIYKRICHAIWSESFEQWSLAGRSSRIICVSGECCSNLKTNLHCRRGRSGVRKRPEWYCVPQIFVIWRWCIIVFSANSLRERCLVWFAFYFGGFQWAAEKLIDET